MDYLDQERYCSRRQDCAIGKVSGYRGGLDAEGARDYSRSAVVARYAGKQMKHCRQLRCPAMVQKPDANPIEAEHTMMRDFDSRINQDKSSMRLCMLTGT